MATRGILVTVLALGACSPFGGNAFSCEQDEQCGAGNKCMTGYCALADTSCPSGFKFSASSGSLSNTCVTDGSNGTDAMRDSFVDPSNKCFGTGFGKVCFAPADVPVASLEINVAISTDGSMCSTKVVDSPPWCVIAATDLTIDQGKIAVTGEKPLVLVASGTLTINGTLDVSSHLAPAQAGAGHDLATTCDAGTLPKTDGGGAGGSFGTVGGAGGDGNTNNNNPNNTGGVAGAIEPTNVMRGGCLGQDGDGAGTADGRGGLGGGAVYLIAGTAISFGNNASIDASGAAGSGGKSNKAGGGAGGSGGLIGLDSPMVSMMNNGSIFANGGGGAEGATGGTTGGDDGNESQNGAIAAKSGSHQGGDGGAGGAAGDMSNDGGGGGGGGVGAIRLFQASSIINGGTVSPTPTL